MKPYTVIILRSSKDTEQYKSQRDNLTNQQALEICNHKDLIHKFDVVTTSGTIQLFKEESLSYEELEKAEDECILLTLKSNNVRYAIEHITVNYDGVIDDDPISKFLNLGSIKYFVIIAREA